MRRVWRKKLPNSDVEEVVTIKNIEILLGGKSICSMGSKQTKMEAAYDYSRMNIIMGTDSNVSNSIAYTEYMVNMRLLSYLFLCIHGYRSIAIAIVIAIAISMAIETN